MKCTCGSTNVIRTNFRRMNGAGFTIESQKSGFFDEVVILPEVWVCKECRQILFRVPKDRMDVVKENRS